MLRLVLPRQGQFRRQLLSRQAAPLGVGPILGPIGGPAEGGETQQTGSGGQAADVDEAMHIHEFFSGPSFCRKCLCDNGLRRFSLIQVMQNMQNMQNKAVHASRPPVLASRLNECKNAPIISALARARSSANPLFSTAYDHFHSTARG